jgi:hypothetical protein
LRDREKLRTYLNSVYKIISETLKSLLVTKIVFTSGITMRCRPTGMYHARRRSEMHTKCEWEKLKGRDDSKDVSVN